MYLWSTEPDLSLHECPHSKQLAMGTLREEEPRLPVRDPRGGGLGPLCAKPLHRVGKYDMFVFQGEKKPLQSL